MATTVGFDQVEVGVFDAAGETITDTFVWRDEKGGTVDLTITGLEKEVVRVEASNGVVWQSKKGTGQVTSTFNTFNPPKEDLNKVLGKKVDGKASWMGENTDPPFVAMIAKSEDADGTPFYMALPKGLMGMNEITVNTRTQDGSNPPSNTALTGSWQNTEIGGERVVYGDFEGDEGFDEWRQSVFPGAPTEPAV